MKQHVSESLGQSSLKLSKSSYLSYPPPGDACIFPKLSVDFGDPDWHNRIMVDSELVA